MKIIRSHNSPIKSSAIFANEEMSVRDCLRIMRKSKSRAILLTRAEGNRELITGFFSESDLVKKVAFLEHPLNWARPIKTIMRKDVRSLPADRLDFVGQFMLKYEMRSVPIVSSRGPLYRDSIWGMVHAIDLVQSYTTAPDQGKGGPKIAASILSKNPRYPNFIFGLLQKNYRVRLVPSEQIIRPNMPLRLNIGLDILFIDLNHFSIDDVLPIIRTLKEIPKPPSVAFMLEENQFPPRALKSLLQLGSNNKFCAILKPINPAEFNLNIDRLIPLTDNEV